MRNLPKKVGDILNGFDENKDGYKECRRLLTELRPLGYTFEYGLDAEPYDLKKL